MLFSMTEKTIRRNKMVNIVLTGLNGYGEHFIPELLEENKEYRLVAVISRDATKSSYYEELKKNHVSFYTSLEEALNEQDVHLVMITTPMHIHYKEVMTALRAGANVYCEKPLAPTIDECLEIKQAAEEAGKIVAVGFQWSFSKGILAFKKDILDNRYGKLRQIKTLVNWNRPKSYFEGSSWKGKMVLSDGTYVLESVMSNGAAHFLHNLFFLCGESLETSGYPAWMEGEAYHAHRVEGCDTTMLRMETTKGTELLYYATIVAEHQEPAQFTVTFDHAVATYPAGEEKKILVVTEKGETTEYDCPDDHRFSHFKTVVKAIRDNKHVTCEVETILPEVIAVNAAAESIPVKKFPPELVIEDKTNIYAHHMDKILKDCYEKACLPEEAGYPFAKTRRSALLADYRHFRGL